VSRPGGSSAVTTPRSNPFRSPKVNLVTDILDIDNVADQIGL
jgi:hypothetical protein